MNTSNYMLSAYLLLCTICITASEEYSQLSNGPALITEKFCERHNLEQIQNTNQKLERLETQFKVLRSNIEKLMAEVKTLATQPQVPRPLSGKSTGFNKEIEALIRPPKLSFDGLEETLSQRQQEAKRLIVKRSRDRNPPELSSGLALYGPPGNGKTRYAEALAHAAKYQFCSIKGGYLNKDYAGDGASRVMAIAQCARKYASKGIIFFVDEFDVMAKSRADLGGGSAAANMAATMSMLWDIIPQIHQDYKHAVFIAATNRIEDCDKAMKDRFLTRIPFDYPTVAQMDIARDHHLSRLRHSLANSITWPYQSNDPSEVEESQKISFRDIAFLVKKAGEFAYTADPEIITQEHVDRAWDRVLENKKQDSKPSEEEQRRQREIENHEMQKKALEIQQDSNTQQYHSQGLLTKLEYHGAKLLAK